MLRLLRVGGSFSGTNSSSFSKTCLHGPAVYLKEATANVFVSYSLSARACAVRTDGLRTRSRGPGPLSLGLNYYKPQSGWVVRVGLGWVG